jgi:hypothetical protein
MSYLKSAYGRNEMIFGKKSSLKYEVNADCVTALVARGFYESKEGKS